MSEIGLYASERPEGSSPNNYSPGRLRVRIGIEKERTDRVRTTSQSGLRQNHKNFNKEITKSTLLD
jgi:hypothetical protein